MVTSLSSVDVQVERVALGMTAICGDVLRAFSTHHLNSSGRLLRVKGFTDSWKFPDTSLGGHPNKDYHLLGSMLGSPD